MGASDEAMLSARERAALAQLEARAAADDPRFADHLRGGQVRRRSPGRLPDPAWLTTVAGHLWLSMRPSLWGPLLVVAGLALAVAGVSTSLLLGVLGIAVTGAGLALLATLATERAAAGRVRRALEVPKAPRD